MAEVGTFFIVSSTPDPRIGAASPTYTNQEAADADCKARNGKAAELGIQTRYQVVESAQPLNPQTKPRGTFGGL